MNIYRVAISVIAMLLICIAQVDAKPGNGGGKPKPPPEPPPPTETSCAGYVSDFPAFAYTVQKGSSRRISGYDFYLSNVDGDCSIKIHTSDYNEGLLEFSYSQNLNNGVIVWRQSFNEYGGRKDADRLYDRIKLIRFETEAKAVTSSLPLASTTVAVTTANHNGFPNIDLSADGETIAVSVGNNDAGFEINTISEIDISICSAECDISAPLITSAKHYIGGLGYSPFMDRIYYVGFYHDDPSEPLAGQRFVAFIEKQGIAWSDPRFVTLSGNGLHGNSNYFRAPDVAVMDYGLGLTEVVAFNYEYYDSQWQDTLMILDVGNCSATAGPGDCFSLGDASVFKNIADGGTDASFDNKFNATSLFATQDTSVIVKHDLLTNAEVIVTDGFQADSGN